MTRKMQTKASIDWRRGNSELSRQALPSFPKRERLQQAAYLVPKVESSRDGHHGEEDASHDEEADLDVGEQEEREEEDADEAEPHVAPQLLPDYPVCLPRDVHGAVREGV